MKKAKKAKTADVLQMVAAAIAKKYGTGSIARLSDEEAGADVEYVIPTGLPALDDAFGCAGLPLGKMLEVAGPESVGKSTLAKFLAAQAQRSAVKPYLLDCESSSDLRWDVALGLNPDEILISRPDSMEDAFGMMHAFAKSIVDADSYGLCILDSLAAVRVSQTKDDDFTATRGYPREAMYLSTNLPRFREYMDTGRVSFILVNQVRQNLGATRYQPQTRTPGGYALHHWCHIRMELRRAGWIKERGQRVGIRSRVKMVKNKVGPPLKEVLMDIRWDPPRVSEGAWSSDDGEGKDE